METKFYDESQARRFLATAIAWPDGQINGIFNVVTKAPPSAGFKSPLWRHTGVTTIDDAIRAINHSINKGGATDIYGWMALGNTNAVPLSARPGSWYKGNRLAENAVWFKSIFLDVDFGEKKHYKTLAEAQAALDAFIVNANLPKPNIVVSSGHGFHCHWTTTEPIAADRWQMLSSRLLGAVMQHGLHCDTQVTIDRARILRIPGTWNNKYPDSPVKVELIREEDSFFVDRLEARLAGYQPHVAPASAGKSTRPEGAENLANKGPYTGDEQLAEGVETTKLEVDIEAAVPECPLISDALDTAGANHANPLWHQMVWMASFCQDGREVAHQLSSGHASYSEEECDREYDRVLKTRENRPELGWTSCQKFHDNGGDGICRGCPHLAEGKSPFNFLTFESKTAEPEPPPDVLVGLTIGDGELFLPDGFIRDNEKRICEVVQPDPDDENGQVENVPISDNKIHAGYLTDRPKTLHFTYTSLANSGKFIPDRASLELRLIAKSGDMCAHLASQGFMVHAGRAKATGSFLVGWVEELKKAQEGIYFNDISFGWVERDNRIAGFAYDCINWAPVPWPAPAPKLEYYKPQGDLDVWKAATKLVTSQKRPELEILLAVAFAAPLVRLLGDTAKGIQIFAWSKDSGVTKTAALTVAAAVWGHPVLTMNAANDTTNAVDKKMGDLRHLPVLWDEFKTSEDTDAFIMQIFRASGGKGKSRLSSDTSYRAVGSWATILACASNAPMLDRIYRAVGRTNAGLLRVFEYEIVTDQSRMTMANEAKTMLLALESNYGKAGEAYAKWLGENFDRVIEDLRDFRNKLDKSLDNPAQERFWSATTTVLVKGAEYAKKLGLVDFDERAMLLFCLKLVATMREATGRQPEPTKHVNDLKELLTAYRADLQQYETVRFESVYTSSAPGRPKHAYKPYQYNPSNLRVFSICESDLDDVIRFTATSLTDWLTDRRKYRDPFGEYGHAEIIKAMENLLGAKVYQQGRLAPGFDKDIAGKQKIVEISTALHPDLKSTFK
jgi:hypothetical protein